MPSGRKEAMIRKLFRSIPVGGKTKKVMCQFCQWLSTDNATRLKKHIRTCSKCPADIKQLYAVAVHVSEATKRSHNNNMHTNSQHLPSLPTFSELKATTASKPSTNLTSSFNAINDSSMTAPNASVVKSKSEPLSGKRSISSMNNFMDRMDAEEQQEITELVARAIFGSGTPLSFVQHPL